MCFFPLQRLRISRHHPGSSLRISAPQTAPEPHGLHGTAARSAGEDLPEDTLPGCSDERTAGHVHQPARGPSAGTRTADNTESKSNIKGHLFIVGKLGISLY